MSATAPALVETGLFLEGLHCSGCVTRVERRLREEPGVAEASVSFTSHRALVRHDRDRVDVGVLVKAVEDLGYAATPFDPDALERPAAQDAREALVRLLVAAFLAGNVMLLALGLYIAGPDGMEPGVRRGLRWLALVLSLPAVVYCAAPFWRGAWSGLRRREITIDLPVSLGIGSAFAAGVLGTWSDAPHVFVDSAATIVFLILFGRTLERGARARATGAVARLVAMTPATALRRGDAGVEEVPAASLRVGDRVVVPPGQTFPADGTLLEGSTEVDESLLTGESYPVLRACGDPVTGGSRNVSTEVEMTVGARAGEGVLAAMAALLERAEATRPHVQRLADRVARVFAPTVVLLALATGLGWIVAGEGALAALMAAAAVLIVACPCALGLATPAAVTAALGRGARAGLLFKSGEAFERCAGVDVAVLDKTGTVSEGRLALREIQTSPGQDADAVLTAALAAEGQSVHPMAEALRAAAAERGIAAPDGGDERRIVPGRGVIAGDLRVGSRALLDDASIAVPAALDAALEPAERSGASLAFVARGSEVLGCALFVDPARPDAAQAVTRLRSLGVEPVLVSGDHVHAVASTARQAGIDSFEAGATPEAKVGAVAELRRNGHRVLAAGDGVNDAAALAGADVGVAMARGADVTVHAADVVVLAPRLDALGDAIGLSRATLQRIRENLGLAIAYNLVAVPLAMAGVLGPLGAAIAMGLSSLVVTGNAVRLLRWNPAS